MDRPQLTQDQAFNVLFTFSRALLELIRWLVFAVFHLTILVLFLLLLWIFQVTPSEICEWAQSLSESKIGQGTLAALGVAGLSGAALLAGYLKLWKKVSGALTANYLMKGLEP